MNKDLNNEQPLENIAPLLSKIEKKNSFKVPENYFEALPQVATDNILNNKSEEGLFGRFYYRLFVPVLSLIVIVFLIWNPSDFNNDSTLTAEELGEIIVEEEWIDFDEEMIYESYEEVLEEEAAAESEASDESEDELTDELIDYLIENDVDINSIIDEL